MIHISNNFVSSNVHASLVSFLSGQEKQQLVIVPVRDRTHIGLNSSGLDGVAFRYIKFSNFLRYFPLIKVIYLAARCYRILRECVRKEGRGVGSPRVIAHNFWSDGMLAYFNSLFIPMRYTLVVRNTDINYFVAKLPHYRWLMKRAIKGSEGLVFVSRSHYLRFSDRWPELMHCARKVEVIPNGLSSWWLDKVSLHSNFRSNQVCFVGRFNQNKNLANLVKAALIVNEQVPDFRLVLVGGDEAEFCAAAKLNSVPRFVDIRGRLEKEELLEVYRASRLFAMPSFTETFGLVYLEAMSQGCSVICSAGEGIDGMWDEPFIRAVNPADEKEIAIAMLELLQEYAEGIPVEWRVEEIHKFGWKTAGRRYLEFFG